MFKEEEIERIIVILCLSCSRFKINDGAWQEKKFSYITLMKNKKRFVKLIFYRQNCPYCHYFLEKIIEGERQSFQQLIKNRRVKDG